MAVDRHYPMTARRPGKAQTGSRSGTMESAAEWAKGLKLISNELETVTDNTEDEFLAFGRMFMDYHSRAAVISEMSSAVAARMTGAEIVDAVDGLYLLMERMEAHFRRSESDRRAQSETLGEVLLLMNQAYEPLENILVIASDLSLLSLTGKIRNSPPIAGRTEFEGLLEDLRQLSGILHSRAIAIFTSIRSLQGDTGQTLSRLPAFQKEQHHKSDAALDCISNILCYITEQYGICRTVAKGLEHRSEEMARCTEQIVMSIQFHDITRQRFEAVRRALNDVPSKVCGGSCDSHLRGNGTEEKVAAEFADLCDNQALELSRVCDTFVAAVVDIAASLNHLSLNAANLREDTHKMVGNARREQEAFLDGIEGMLSSMTASFEALHKNEERNREISNAVLSITRSGMGIVNFMTDIEKIAGDIEHLDFDVCIRLSQPWKEGAAFEILSDSVRKLAVETCAHAKTLAGVIGLMTSKLRELSDRIDMERRDSVHGMNVLSEDLEILVQRLATLNRDISSTLNNIDREAVTLSRDVGKFTGGINIHAVVEDAVRHSLSGLNRMSSHIRMTIPDKMRGDSGPAIAAEVPPGTTTENSTAGIHDSVKEGTGGSVELFRNTKSGDADIKLEVPRKNIYE